MTRIAPSSAALNKRSYPHLRGWKDRQCTDGAFALVLFVAWVGVAILAAYAYDHGDVARFSNGYDSYGNTCGKPNPSRVNASNSGLDLRGYDHVLYFDARFSPNSIKICVKSCPQSDADSTAALEEAGYCLSSSSSGPYAHDDVSLSYANSGADPTTGCPTRVYASTSLTGRCLPTTAPDDVYNAVMDEVNEYGIVTFIVHDFDQAGQSLLFFVLIAMGVTLLGHVLMHIAPTVVVDSNFAISMGVLWATMAWLWVKYDEKLSNYVNARSNGVLVVRDSHESDARMFLGMAIFATVAAVGSTYAIAVYFYRIRFVPALYAEGNHFLKAMGFGIPLLLLLTFAALLGVTVFFGNVALRLITMSDEKQVEPNHLVFERVKSNWLWFLFLIFAWTILTVVGLSLLSAGVACVRLYFGQPSQKRFVVVSSLLLSCRFHLGSAAYGSVLATLLSPMRVPITWMQLRFSRQNVGARLSSAPYTLKTLFTLSSFNMKAIADIGLRGTSFTNASYRALQLTFRNAPSVQSIGSTLWYSVLSAKLLLTGIATLAALRWFEKEESLQYPGLFVFLASLATYVLAEVTCGLHAVIGSTLLVNFCEDIAEQDGSNENPFYSRLALVRFLAREERRFQREIEDVFEKKTHAAKVARLNYEKSLEYHIEKHMEPPDAVSSDKALVQEHWKRTTSRKRMPAMNRTKSMTTNTMAAHSDATTEIATDHTYVDVHRGIVTGQESPLPQLRTTANGDAVDIPPTDESQTASLTPNGTSGDSHE